jgi:heat shock protein HslJ
MKTVFGGSVTAVSWLRRAALLLAFALLAPGLALTGRSGPSAVASPPVSPGPVDAAHPDGRWRLTAVTAHGVTTEIPESADAWLQLTDDGEFTASDGVNTMGGRLTPTGTGFDVTDVLSTEVAYIGDDPAQLAAMSGIGAMALDPDALRISVSADTGHLSVEAGTVRLTFIREPSAAAAPAPRGDAEAARSLRCGGQVV